MLFLPFHIERPWCCRVLSKYSHTSFTVRECNRAHLFPVSVDLICSLLPLSLSLPSTPFFLHFYLLSPRRYHSSPSSASALRRDSRTTTAITAMWVWEGARGEKDGVIREERGRRKTRGGKERNCNFRCSTKKMFITLMCPLRGKQAKHKMQYWQIY